MQPVIGYVERVKNYLLNYRKMDAHHTVDIREPLPKPSNSFVQGKKVLVSRVKTGKNIKADVKKAIQLIGGLEKAFKKTDSVLLLPNFNSDDPYPASSDLAFLEAIIRIFQEFGIKNITLGSTSGVHWLPTRDVLKKMGVLDLARRLNINYSCFEEHDWVLVQLHSDILSDLSFTKDIFEYDKIVYLPCMKSHRRARFTMSLKLTMALLCLKHRVVHIHVDGIEEKLADLNKAVCPALIIMDARKIFVTGGPDKGEVADLNLIYASGDRVAIDFVGLKDLLKQKHKDPLLDKKRPEEYGQLKRAFKIKLGVERKEDIKVINA